MNRRSFIASLSGLLVIAPTVKATQWQPSPADELKWWYMSDKEHWQRVANHTKAHQDWLRTEAQKRFESFRDHVNATYIK